jgi:ribonuclease Z
MARIVFLGTSAALPTGRRTNTQLAVLPDGGESGILVDCGGDCFGALDRAAIGPDVISDLFITHAHIDHIGSLPSLIESLRLSGRTQPLHIWALPEVMAIARELLTLFSFELKLDEWPFTLSFHDVQGGQRVVLAGIPVRIEVMAHTVPSAGVRFELPGGDVAYTSDTQPDAGVSRLATGARVLITESSMLEAEGDLARLTRHMTAARAGEQAKVCGVRELYLVHIGKAWPPEAAVAEAARAFDGTIIVPDDGETITV